MSSIAPPPTPYQFLLVEDSADDAELSALALRRAGLTFNLRRVETEEALRSALDTLPPDLVLCDYHLPRFNCHEALEVVNALCPGLKVIVVSRHIDPQEEAEVLRRGAAGCVRKANLQELAATVTSVLRPES